MFILEQLNIAWKVLDLFYDLTGLAPLLANKQTFKGGVAELLKRLLKVPGSNPREA